MANNSSQTNNVDGNIQLHLNANIARTAYATIASSSPVRTQSPAEAPRILQTAHPQQPNKSQQQQLGDIYEFHSSPEEDIFAATGPAGFFPVSNATICSQQKSSSASSIPNILAASSTSCPPPKRIKTAVLAKKLLAAAADSNIIDPSKLPKPCDRKNVQMEKLDGEKEAANKNADETTMEQLVEENDGNADETEANEEEKQRANSVGSEVSQEQKKVPPLRISLLKTPSEEGEGSAAGPSSASSPSGCLPNQLRKTRGVARIVGGSGLRKLEGPESKKENLQRVTRSKVKQINTSNEAGDHPHGRKRRNRGHGIEGGNVELEEVASTSSTLSVRNFPFEEEDNTMSSSANEGGGAMENGSATITSNNLLIGEDEHHRSEDSQQSASMGVVVPIVPVKSEPSAASIMLNKNSLEQSVGFESTIREKWTRQYRAHLNYVIEKMSNNANFIEESNQSNEHWQYRPETKLNNEWPEQLKKLYNEQEKRREELAEEHRLDRERIQLMAQREMARFEEANSRAKNYSNDAKSSLFSIVSYLRDMECYDPSLLAESLSGASSIHHSTSRFHNQSVQQIQQRFTYLANTTKNRHTLEAHSLVENQKAEWQRIARRMQRENEQQQLMMKGPIGGGNVGKQQQQVSKITFPTDFWIDTALNQILIPDVQLPHF